MSGTPRGVWAWAGAGAASSATAAATLATFPGTTPLQGSEGASGDAKRLQGGCILAAHQRPRRGRVQQAGVSLKRMLWGLFAAAAAALALAAPSMAQNEPEFTVVPYDVALGQVADTELDLILPSSTAAPAKVTIYAAPGYTADLTQAPGTKVGDVFATVASGGASLDVRGDVVADNPANYAADPRAQACAPGTHAAVWVITITLGGTSLRIPIYVDATTGAEAALGSYKLQVCFASPYVPESQGGAPLGARLTEADIDFPTTPGVWHNPSARGIYTWRALVTPYTQGTATPNAAGTYELRSLASLPTRIALKGKFDKKRNRVVLT